MTPGHFRRLLCKGAFSPLFLLLIIASLSIPAAMGQDVSAGGGIDLPDTVHIGAYILSIHDLNFHEREYTVRFWVWMQYRYPDFHFDRRVEVPNAKTVEKPDTIIEGTPSASGKEDSLFQITLKMKCVMKQDWDVSHFPFDRQQLDIWIENTKYDTASLVFVMDASGKFYDPQDSLTVQGWLVDSVWATVDTHRYPTAFGPATDSTSAESSYSRYRIHVAIHREPWGLFFKIFMGMYVAFIISFVAFFIDPETVDPHFEIPIGGLIAVVGNKYIIEPLLPEASTLTIVDFLHVITLAFIFVILVVSTLSLSRRWKEGSTVPRKLNRYGAISIALAYAIINVIAIYTAAHGS